MKEQFISTSNFPVLLEKLLADSRVFAPRDFNKRNILQEVKKDNVGRVNLRDIRAVESFKSCFFSVSEVVSEYFGDKEQPKSGKITILGARGCDLEALDVEDRVFGEGDVSDPFYMEKRKNSFVIGADCTSCGKTCFCTLVNGKPYPTRLFDLSLSIVDGGYVVEIGSDKGQKFVDANKNLFSDATAGSISSKQSNRDRVTGLLDDLNRDYIFKMDISESHKRNLENECWKVLTKDCVECSSCNLICPTCTCFFLADQKAKDGAQRSKVWDACLKAGYQRVAGGANPRGMLYQRLQNRYHCKMDHSYDRLGRYTCVGCGRCIDGCAGNIDMRKIFLELQKQVPLQAKLVEL